MISNKNRDDRWNNLENSREDRQNWRDQNREDWQDHREDMWDYRFDRADEIWDNCGDFYDDCFDDHWWGGCGWGDGYVGDYPVESLVVVGTGHLAAAHQLCLCQLRRTPVYVDHGTTVVYEGETVYVDNKPMPAETYNEPIENSPPPSSNRRRRCRPRKASPPSGCRWVSSPSPRRKRAIP